LVGRQDGAGEGKQDFARLGQLDVTGRAVDERLADGVFQAGDVVADRRLQCVEARGGPAEGPLGRHREQAGEQQGMEEGAGIYVHSAFFYDLYVDLHGAPAETTSVSREART